MAVLSTNLLGILSRSADAGTSSAMASFSGTSSGQVASASARVVTSAHDQGAISVVEATVQANSDDSQVTSIGNAMASGETTSTLVSLAAAADPDGAIAGAVTVNADAEAADGGLATTTSLAMTQVDANNIEITSSGEAAASGGKASALVTMVASLDQEAGIVVMDLAQAEAQATEDGTASARAGPMRQPIVIS